MVYGVLANRKRTSSCGCGAYKAHLDGLRLVAVVAAYTVWKQASFSLSKIYMHGQPPCLSSSRIPETAEAKDRSFLEADAPINYLKNLYILSTL